jgi:plastocyanin
MIRKCACSASLAAAMGAMVMLLVGSPSVIANTREMVGMYLLLTDSPGVAANARQSAPATAEVKIDNFSFAPQAITVAVGTTVTWTNRDDIPHTVVADDKSFKSKVLDTDEKFSYTFAKAGAYPYFCSIHPKMTGKVVVQ